MAKPFAVEQKMIRVDLLECNSGQVKGVPKNPRFINVSRFEKLKQSIADDPEFLQVRELVVYPLYTGKYCILAGNMRFRAAKELGILKFPCKVVSAGTDSKKIRSLVIKDNVAFGEDDFDQLSQFWDKDELSEFGVKGFEAEMDALEKEADEKKIFKDEEESEPQQSPDDIAAEGTPDLIFPANNAWGLPTLDISMQATTLEAPFMSFGFKRGWRELARTVHFYIDDWRFNRLWDSPEELLGGGVAAVVEPNFSVSPITPRAYAIWCFFKKRWLARFWQSQGLKTFVDLNVPPAFLSLATLGVPRGWNAFFTRGVAGTEEWLEAELKIARKISGRENPFFCVYAGGESIERFCRERNLTFLPELHERWGEKKENNQQKD